MVNMNIEDVIPNLLAACPSAQFVWQEHRKFWSEEAAGLFNDISVFAQHAVDSYASEKTGEFPALFGLIERMITEGNAAVSELAIIGFIEDLQNISSHRWFGSKVFKKWLGPASRQGWQSVEKMWEGKTSLMDVLRDEAAKKSRGEN